MFQVGDAISLEGQKGNIVINRQAMTVTATTTLEDLTTFINGTIGINTSPGANGLLATVPGVSVVTTGNEAIININGNLGSNNDIERLSDLTITRGGTPETPITFKKNTTADGDSVFTRMQIYDSLGALVTVKIVASLTSLNNGSTWTYYATSDDNMPLSNGNPQTVVGTGVLNFDAQGKLLSVSNDYLTVNRAGTGAMPNLTFSLDFFKVTSFASGQVDSVLNMATKDGLSMGTLQSYNIGSDGVITGVFNNGLTRTLGQVAVALFQNDLGLIDIGNNNYTAGPNSGNAMIVAPNQLGAGAISSCALELSNVDLSGEFVSLIMASTAFSANSRVISSSNSMLQELLAATR